MEVLPLASQPAPGVVEPAATAALFGGYPASGAPLSGASSASTRLPGNLQIAGSVPPEGGDDVNTDLVALIPPHASGPQEQFATAWLSAFEMIGGQLSAAGEGEGSSAHAEGGAASATGLPLAGQQQGPLTQTSLVEGAGKAENGVAWPLAVTRLLVPIDAAGSTQAPGLSEDPATAAAAEESARQQDAASGERNPQAQGTGAETDRLAALTQRASVAVQLEPEPARKNESDTNANLAPQFSAPASTRDLGDNRRGDLRPANLAIPQSDLPEPALPLSNRDSAEPCVSVGAEGSAPQTLNRAHGAINEVLQVSAPSQIAGRPGQTAPSTASAETAGGNLNATVTRPIPANVVAESTGRSGIGRIQPGLPADTAFQAEIRLETNDASRDAKTGTDRPAESLHENKSDSVARHLRRFDSPTGQVNRQEPATPTTADRLESPGRTEDVLIKTSTPYSPELPASPGSSLAAGASRPATQVVTPAASQLDAGEAEPGRTGLRSAEDVTVQLRDAVRGAANLRFTERGGQVEVTVRAADPQLVQSLRSGMDHLRSSLELQGFQANVWIPASSSTQSLRAMQESSSDTYQHSDEDPAAQDRASYDESGRRDQGAEEWMDEIA